MAMMKGLRKRHETLGELPIFIHTVRQRLYLPSIIVLTNDSTSLARVRDL